MQAAAPATGTPERQVFCDRSSGQNLMTLRTSLANLVTPEPRSPCQPASWRFDDMRALHLHREGRGNA